MIDYLKIFNAVRHYRGMGYEYMEVPWIVSIDTILITRPPGARLFSTFAGELVASGEQSFLEIRKNLKPGKYQCVTPCFRDEKVHDELHLQYFLKNELIWVPDIFDRNIASFADVMIQEALGFFKNYASDIKVIDVPMDNSIVNKDILINDIEVGSYGVRQLTGDGFIWVYGTGCAEPRLSQVMLKTKSTKK